MKKIKKIIPIILTFLTILLITGQTYKVQAASLSANMSKNDLASYFSNLKMQNVADQSKIKAQMKKDVQKLSKEDAKTLAGNIENVKDGEGIEKRYGLSKMDFKTYASALQSYANQRANQSDQSGGGGGSGSSDGGGSGGGGSGSSDSGGDFDGGTREGHNNRPQSSIEPDSANQGDASDPGSGEGETKKEHKTVIKQKAQPKILKSLTEMIDSADNFINSGDGKQDDTLDSAKLKESIGLIYSILIAIGSFLAVAIGIIVGIKLMTAATTEEKAKYKKALIVYIIGLVVIFGAMGIWKVAISAINTAM